MRILYDYQVFQNQKYGGISKYFIELMTHFSPDVVFEIGLKYTNNIHILEMMDLPFDPLEDFQIGFLKDSNFIGKGRITNLYSKLFPQKVKDCYKENLLSSLSLVEKEDYDVFHPTYYNPYFLDHIKKPFVITFFPPSDITGQQKRKLINNASHIIAVSNNTKSDLLKYYGIDESRITVIHHGITRFNSKEELNIKLPDRYLLYVGDRRGYKNFYFLLNSIADILEKNDLSIVCAGLPLTSDEKSMIDTLNISNRIFQHFASENEMTILYRNAVAFIFPSLYEGFGMPILEAFASNCPVLLSDSSCFNEIAGDAALYFDPKSKQDICKLVERIALDQNVRESLIIKGCERMKLFSWTDTANKTHDVYSKVLSR
jgi:glycosyltransferase involved in cell wall biosynthesis